MRNNGYLQKEADKQKEQERMKELMTKAEQHHQKAVMKYWGWIPLHKLIVKKRNQEKLAREFYNRSLLRYVKLFEICFACQTNT
jgi:hypothetical protein